MENFLTWDILTTYASFISIVFMIVSISLGTIGLSKFDK